MKKIIICCVCAVLVVGIAVGAIFAVNHFKDRENNKVDGAQGVDSANEIDLLLTSNTQDLEIYADELGLKLEKTDENTETSSLCIYGASIFGASLDMYFYVGESDAIANKKIYFVPFEKDYENQEKPTPKNHSGTDVKKETQKIFKVIEETFGVEIKDRFAIFSGNDLLEHTDDAFKKVFSGEATLNFTLKDQQGCFWNLHSMKVDDIMVYELEIDYDSEKYEDYVVNLDVRNEANA